MSDERLLLDALAQTALMRGPSAADADFLQKTECWRPEQFRPHQLKRLQQLLRVASRDVPYYRERAALYAHFVNGEPTSGAWQGLPLISRDQVLAHTEALHSEALPKDHEVVREANSSGSTGRHVSVWVSRTSARVVDAISERDHRWHQRDTSLSAAAIRAVPRGTAIAKVGKHSWGRGGGRLSVLEVHTPVREQLEWLREREPAYIATYASNARALLESARDLGVRWEGLREMGTFGEVVDDTLRELARAVWQVPLIDAYSCVELGHLALQCPTRAHYHVQSENVLLEVLKPDGSPAEPGELGRVVVSTLHNFAMPLIRYELGDFAIAGAACDCGKGLPVLESIVGRVRNLMRVRTEDGEDQLWPRYASNVLGKYFAVRQFRLVQQSYEDFELELVSEPLGDAELADLRRMVLQQLTRNVPHPLKLEVRYVSEIPRGPGGKFEDFVCRFRED
ncbi:MAG: phenylacetate--CoA ligase family protein [Polyangiaceae bacterium]|nr:phenylacetate--CoA ligase family protein [Polyangiaceae bacterium]